MPTRLINITTQSESSRTWTCTVLYSPQRLMDGLPRRALRKVEGREAPAGEARDGEGNGGEARGGGDRDVKTRGGVARDVETWRGRTRDMKARGGGARAVMATGGWARKGEGC